MRKKGYLLSGLLIAALLVVGAVQAFDIGNIDGVWDLIDDGGGATGQAWASGPPANSTDFNNPQFITTNQADRITTQNQVLFDWNQVRYGSPTAFGSKSGFGFLGRTSVGESPAKDIPFLLGQFCHFNNPISASNPFGFVELDLTVSGIACEPPLVLDGPDTIEFSYIFNLDETPNAPGICFVYGTGDCLCRVSALNYRNRCAYGPQSPLWPADGGSYCVAGQTAFSGPDPAPGQLNYNGCADRVNITKSVVDAFFTCEGTVDGNTVTQDFTVSLLGFIKEPEDGCPETVPPGTDFSNNLVYTAEEADNCFCVYGAITDEDITPVVMLSFDGEGTADGNALTWVTATEIHHLGFNVLRATSLYSVKEQINSELVIGDSNPGNPFGAYYVFLDETAESGVTYYYWVEDVPSDTSFSPELFGPVIVERP